MTERSATAAVEVAADPVTAFQVFTEEIDLWWVRNPINFWDSGRVTAMRIEPGVGGRVLEVYSGDDVLELATITEWEPGARLGYRSSVDDTETRIDFAAVDGGTRVTVVQSLVRDDGKAFYFWPRVIRWIPAWVARRSTAPRTPRELDRLTIALSYDDPSAAARWLHTVFGLDSWDSHPRRGRQPFVDRAQRRLSRRTPRQAHRPTPHHDRPQRLGVRRRPRHPLRPSPGGRRQDHHRDPPLRLHQLRSRRPRWPPLDLRPSPAHDGVTGTPSPAAASPTASPGRRHRRRPASARSAFTRDLLQLLDRRGFDAAPRSLGRHDGSRDILTYQDRWVPAKPERSADYQLAAVGVLIGAFHDAARGTFLAAHQDVVRHTRSRPDQRRRPRQRPARLSDMWVWAGLLGAGSAGVSLA